MVGCTELHKSSRNCTAFRWTPARARAAKLVCADELTDAQIAAAVGVCRRTLAYWKTRPEFQARVERHLAEFKAAIDAERAAQTEREMDRMWPARKQRRA